jgi:hypothetical protein
MSLDDSDSGDLFLISASAFMSGQVFVFSILGPS